MKIYPVIMAGGSGTRFWPLSREDHPKQFLHIAGKESLFQKTVDRLGSLFPLERIHVVAPPRYHDQILEEVPDLTEEALLHEPAPRDTAPCIGLAAFELLERDEDAAMYILPSDHYISERDRYARTIELAGNVMEHRPESLVCFGIQPDRPATGYGYIRRGEEILVEEVGEGVYRADGFTEKPELETARDYLKSGNYYWNSGMFAWRADTILKNLEQNAPSIYRGLQEYRRIQQEEDSIDRLREHFSNIPSRSIDYAVMEQAEEVVIIESTFQWEDMGTWDSIRELLESDDHGNMVFPDSLSEETEESILYSSDEDHMIATLGVEDLVVVHTPDVTLVCPVDRAQDVKKLVEKLEQIGDNKHL